VKPVRGIESLSIFAVDDRSLGRATEDSLSSHQRELEDSFLHFASS